MATESRPGPDREAPGRTGRRDRIARIARIAAVVAVAAAGLVLRVWILRHGAGAVDSDEAVAGLMARHFARGSFTTFFWGQQYGGSLEPMLAGAVFRVAGSSPLTLKLVPVMLSGVAALLVWRIGRRMAGERAGVVAGALCWLWPAAYVWWSTKERGFYWVALALGLVVVLTAQRLDEQPARRTDWLVLGAAIGLGWWTSPQIVVFALPAFGWLAWRHRRGLWPGAAYALGAAVLGSIPWWRANVHSHWASLDVASQRDHHGFWSHLWSVLHHGLPTALGLRSAYTEQWVLGALGPAIFVALLVVVVAGAIRAWKTPAGRVVVLATAFAPLLLAAAPNTQYVGEGRYELFVWPFLALLIASAATHPRAPRAVAPSAVAAAFLLTATTLAPLDTATLPHAPDVHVPARMGPLVRALESHHVTAAFADYWIAYRLAFESDEHVVATPSGAVRWPAFDARVRQSACPVYVFPTASGSLPDFEHRLARLHVGARRVTAGGFTIVAPDRHLDPEQVWAAPADQLSPVRTGRNEPSCQRANV
ncbi:MAG: glycosyltransferase family 39 protein [Acidimicrobiia bacterium]